MNTPDSALFSAAASFAATEPSAAAKSLFERFRDLASFDAETTIAAYQTLNSAWYQAMHAPSGAHHLMTQVEKARLATVSRMVSLCLRENGSKRRNLYRRFMATLQANHMNRPLGLSEDSNEVATLKTVPLWFYWGFLEN